MSTDPWEPGQARDDLERDPKRTNVLAVLSVLTGALGLAMMGCFYGVVFSGPFGVIGLGLGLLARRQAAETGYGASYAWWGLLLGGINLGVSLLGGAFLILALML